MREPSHCEPRDSEQADQKPLAARPQGGVPILRLELLASNQQQRPVLLHTRKKAVTMLRISLPHVAANQHFTSRFLYLHSTTHTPARPFPFVGPDGAISNVIRQHAGFQARPHPYGVYLPEPLERRSYPAKGRCTVRAEAAGMLPERRSIHSG